MCRVYRRTGSEPYIRLCAYFGENKGERIPVKGAEWVGSGHVRKIHSGGRGGRLLGPRPAIKRCPKCYLPLSRDASPFEPCSLCQKGR
jgi:hypothetical protein